MLHNPVIEFSSSGQSQCFRVAEGPFKFSANLNQYGSEPQDIVVNNSK